MNVTQMQQRPLVPNEEKIEQLKFVIKGRVEGQRLDQYLGKRFADYSRMYMQKLIKSGRVLVDGKTSKSSAKLRPGQEIEVFLPKLEPLYLKPEAIPLEIIYEDDDLALLNKQSDLVIHPARGHHSGTLVNGLLSYFANLSDYTDVYRPGIVHRLDRFTTGALLVAKNNKAHALLAQQFENRVIQKEYLALAEGRMKAKEGTIALPLGLDKRNRERMVVCHGGKKSLTNYKVLARYPKFTLVHVFPKTGRTHQIRVHLKSQGHPIVADHMYGTSSALTTTTVLQVAQQQGLQVDTTEQRCLISRQALHAWRITFDHPSTHKRMTLTASLPEDLCETLMFLQKLWPCDNVAKLLAANQGSQ